MSRVLDLLDRYASLKAKRDVWRPIYQELADLLHPIRASFTNQTGAGQELQPDIYDGTPMQARRGLATAIDGLMKPSTTMWFWQKARDEALNEEDEAKQYFDLVQRAMWDAIYYPPAGFIPQSNAVDNDIATFGWGPLLIKENRAKTGLTFRSLFIGDVAIDENAEGQIDTACITRMFTARQAAQAWPTSALGPKVLEALDSPNPKDRDKQFEFIECIYPRSDRDVRMKDSANLPFASVVLCKEDERIVEETGYHEFPMAIPRWEVMAGQVYPRSPGMLALADSRTLQAMGHTMLVAGQKAADPPTWAVDDGVMSVVRTFPGGLTMVSAETIKDTGGHPMGVLESGANLPITRDMQADYRRMVEAAFLKNVLGLPVDGPDMTATEIIERKDEYIRTLGPALGQLQNDYPGAIIPRVHGIMSRASYVQETGEWIPGGPLPPIPDSLKGARSTFEFMSPIQQAKKQREAAGLGQYMQFIAPMIEINPALLDNIDGDEIVRDLPETFGVRQKWIKSIDQRDAERQQRQEAMAAAQGLMEAQGAADVVDTAAAANQKLAQAERPAA